MMVSKRTEQICATAGDAEFPVMYYPKSTTKSKKFPLAKLTKNAGSEEYTLNFYEKDGKDPKHAVKLKRPGHNFVLTKHQGGYVRYDVFHFGDNINNISSYLSFEVSNADTDFGNKIITALKAFSYCIFVYKDGSVQKYILHVSCRRLCVTNDNHNAIQFLVSPKAVTDSIIELKCRESIDVPVTQNSPDLKYYELTIHPKQPELFRKIELLVGTFQIADIYQTFKSLLAEENFFASGVSEIYGNSSSNTYETVNEFKSSTGATGATLNVATDTKYGSKRRHGIYSYVKTMPTPTNTSHTYEYVEFRGKKEKSILEYNELTNSCNEVLIDDKNEELNFFVSVFGSLQTLSDYWCISIIFTKFGDQESFQAIKEIEESADHHLIVGCRNVHTASDLLVDLVILSQQFERFGDEIERVSFNDLKSLTSSGMQSWIVIDMLVRYRNEETKPTQFAGYVKLMPSAGDGSEKQVPITDKFPGGIEKTSEEILNAAPSLFQTPEQRKLFKELLDMHDPLSYDWKYFADLMGLSQHDIRVVDSNRSGESYTEQVLMIVERQNPENYNVHFVRSVLEKMQRKDVLDIILDDRAVENNDEVPPLEDMTEQLQTSLKLKPKVEKVKVNEYLEPTEHLENVKENSIRKLLINQNSPSIDKNENEESKSKRKESKKPSNNFGGFKKGFLLQDDSRKKKPTKQRELPVVKKNDIKDKHVIPEVQESLKQQLPKLQSNEWVTEELLGKVMANPKLSKHFADPKFSEAISLFQTDPQQVMSMCQHNVELREFIQEFSGLMGDHFLKMAESQEGAKAKVKSSKKASQHVKKDSAATPEDQEKMRKILSDPEIATIMKSPDIQHLFHLIKTKPDKVSSLLKTADGELRHKIQRLIDVGLLQFSTG